MKLTNNCTELAHKKVMFCMIKPEIVCFFKNDHTSFFLLFLKVKDGAGTVKSPSGK